MKVIEQMLSRYARAEGHHALREVMQEIALAGLHRAGFFDRAAFYGGTCLRIFYGLPRFSEDLDFSLLTADVDFSLEPYFKALQEEFSAFGIELDVSLAKRDVQPFVRSSEVLDIWSSSYFQDLAGRVVFV